MMDEERRELADSVEAAYRFGDQGSPSAPYIDERSFAWHIADKTGKSLPYSRSKSLRKRIRGEAELLAAAAPHFSRPRPSEFRKASNSLFEVAALLDERAETTGEAATERNLAASRKALKEAARTAVSARQEAIITRANQLRHVAAASIPKGVSRRREKITKAARQLSEAEFTVTPAAR